MRANKRILVFKPLQRPPQPPNDLFDKAWTPLAAAVQAIHDHNPVPNSLQELYTKVEDSCIHSLAPKMHDKLLVLCEKRVHSLVASLDRAATEPDTFLALFLAAWSSHCEELLTLRSVFLYLDRTYLVQHATKQSLWDSGLASFRAHLLARPDVLTRLRDGLLRLIERERNGEQVERPLLTTLLRMLHDLALYDSHFGDAFLEATSAFYLAEGEAHLATHDVPAYLAHVDQRLAQEEARVDHYLHSSSRKPLLSAVRLALLSSHIDILLGQGFDALITQMRIDELRLLYSLLSQVSALAEVRAAFGGYIKRVGTAMMNDVEREKQLVAELLAFKDKLDLVLSGAFASNETFGHALKEAFEHFVNVRQNRPAELIARYLDAQLRTSNKGTSEEELEEVLDKTMTLFRYIDGKDMFEAFYKKDLSRRLLLDKSASTDAEKWIISKLRTECGSTFTSKLEGMFKDMELSRDVMESFRSSPHAEKVPSDVELSVHVLTQGYWPTYPPAQVKLPAEILELQEIFTAYYSSKHNGRRLQWHPYLGTCVLRANFASKAKELQVSPLQAIVLLLFNGCEGGMGYADIQQATGVDEGELKLALQSLACGKVRVLRKEPKGKEVEDGDDFHIETSFQHALHRIKINQIQMRETEAENERTSESVFQDRQYQIDAAIVRVMKSRKTLTHPLLVAELLQQLKFPSKPADLKMRIESLIDREYLERDPSSATTYRYLA